MCHNRRVSDACQELSSSGMDECAIIALMVELFDTGAGSNQSFTLATEDAQPPMQQVCILQPVKILTPKLPYIHVSIPASWDIPERNRCLSSFGSSSMQSCCITTDVCRQRCKSLRQGCNAIIREFHGRR